MKKNSIIIGLLIIFVTIITIIYRWQWWTISTDEACTMNDGLYQQSLDAPWPNNAYETKTTHYHISQFYKYKNLLSYPITVKAKWWAQLLEDYENRFYFYSYNCQTTDVNSIDEDNDYGLFETKILEAESGTMLIRHDDVNNPQQLWLHINEDGSVEKDNVSDTNNTVQSNRSYGQNL